jgi:hypothetical protein
LKLLDFPALSCSPIPCAQFITIDAPAKDFRRDAHVHGRSALT